MDLSPGRMSKKKREGRGGERKEMPVAQPTDFTQMGAMEHSDWSIACQSTVLTDC